jgi:hypothetical protein
LRVAAAVLLLSVMQPALAVALQLVVLMFSNPLPRTVMAAPS